MNNLKYIQIEKLFSIFLIVLFYYFDQVNADLLSVKVLSHGVQNFCMRFFVFVILSYQNDFYGCENEEAVCKHDWHNVRSYLFFNVWTIRTKISDSVCSDLKRFISITFKKIYRLQTFER